MKLAKYIHELLLENETVIFPGFGAFVSNYKPAEIKDDKIIPPSKVVSFTPQFRNNDGMLVTFIARKAKISQMYAQKRIDRDRENMLYLLDKGEKVIVENIGVLFNNENNEIAFTPFQDENISVESFGFEPVSITDNVEGPVDAENEEVIKTNEIVADIEKENESVKVEPVEKSAAPRQLPDWAVEQTVEKKKTTWYWYLLILIPILIAGYFVFQDNSTTNQYENIPGKNETTDDSGVQNQTTPATELMQIDSMKKPEPDSVANIKTETAFSFENSKYYIVGGGFKSEENAEKYILRLKVKGIEGKIVGKRGNMFLVGIASFNTEEEAYNELNRIIRENPDWKLWVYQK